jgi:hypothetical protein
MDNQTIKKEETKNKNSICQQIVKLTNSVTTRTCERRKHLESWKQKNKNKKI